MEQYRVFHNKNTKPRNRAEAFMIDFIKSFTACELDMTLQELREFFISEANILPKSYGKVIFKEITIISKIMGKEHIQKRGFAMYGSGRGTYTLSISETVEKDTSK